MRVPLAGADEDELVTVVVVELLLVEGASLPVPMKSLTAT
jgi:hypothetical protein